MSFYDDKTVLYICWVIKLHHQTEKRPAKVNQYRLNHNKPLSNGETLGQFFIEGLDEKAEKYGLQNSCICCMSRPTAKAKGMANKCKEYDIENAEAIIEHTFRWLIVQGFAVSSAPESVDEDG